MADVVGSWSLTTDWGCDGSITGTFSQNFAADGTWTSSPFVHNGRWFQVGCMVIWTFDDVANLVYAANVSGSWMSGIQGYETAGGSNGCFGGRRAGVPALTAKAPTDTKAAEVDPSLGR